MRPWRKSRMIDREKMGDVIQEIVKRIVAGYAPQKIILFGSYAYGQPDEDSDLDFLVVMDTPLPPRQRYVEVRKTIGSLEIPVDVFVLTPEEFKETKDVIGGIAYAPARYGRCLYENS
jgi:predicted nucleotidyltransferase